MAAFLYRAETDRHKKPLAVFLPFMCRFQIPHSGALTVTGAADKINQYQKTVSFMKAKHKKTLALIYNRPVSGGIKWRDIEALFIELGATVQEREGSRVAVVLFGQVQVFHRPHPAPDTDKGAVAAIRKWLETNGVKP